MPGTFKEERQSSRTAQTNAGCGVCGGGEGGKRWGWNREIVRLGWGEVERGRELGEGKEGGKV